MMDSLLDGLCYRWRWLLTDEQSLAILGRRLDDLTEYLLGVQEAAGFLGNDALEETAAWLAVMAHQLYLQQVARIVESVAGVQDMVACNGPEAA